jgi:DNA excision repair protein ERCC-4
MNERQGIDMSEATAPTPYTVIIDTREQKSYTFARPLRVARLRKHFAVVSTRGTLPTGDYSLVGHESRIAIERKSLADLFGTLGAGRARFTRELIRMSAIPHAAIVVEAEWSQIFSSPPRHSQLSPRTIFMSVVSWQIQFPTVHWMFLPSRDVAEAATIRLLDAYWRKSSAASAAACQVDGNHSPGQHANPLSQITMDTAGGQSGKEAAMQATDFVDLDVDGDPGVDCDSLSGFPAEETFTPNMQQK